MAPRSILISGANGSLGQAIVRAFLNESPENQIWLGVHTHRSAADRLAAESAGRCRCLPLDVTSAAAWKAALSCLLQSDQQIHVLVNNAGFNQDNLLATMPSQSWQGVLDTNLTGVFHGCQAVLPAMISQRQGRIINIASLSALLAPAGQANYAAAKAGVIALTQALAKETARIGITVNALCPGYLDTETVRTMPPEQQQAALARIPMRRFGQPDEVAAAVRFLACPEASYITGSVLKIDGGIL